jgi:hypothetical protein
MLVNSRASPIRSRPSDRSLRSGRKPARQLVDVRRVEDPFSLSTKPCRGGLPIIAMIIWESVPTGLWIEMSLA